MDFKFVPVESVPPDPRVRKGVYADILERFLSGKDDVVYIRADSDRDGKNIRLGLNRVINKRKAQVRVSQRRDPPRVYLEKLKGEE